MKFSFLPGLSLLLTFPLNAQQTIPTTADSEQSPVVREMGATYPSQRAAAPAPAASETVEAPFVEVSDPATRPDGAYLTYADYLRGRVDTSLHAEAAYVHKLAELGNHRFSLLRAGLDDARRADQEEVWGYHMDGQEYMAVSGGFYSLTTDDAGRKLVYLPEGAVAPVSNLDGARPLFEVDVENGNLRPHRMRFEGQTVADRTILHGVTGSGGPDVRIRTADGGEYLLGPGEFLLVNGAEVTFSVTGYDWEPLRRNLKRGSADKPVVYEVAALIPGDVRVTKGSTRTARRIREEIEAGELESAR